MSANFPAPLSPHEVDAVRRKAADLRYAAYRSVAVALWRGLSLLAAPLTRRIAAKLADSRAFGELAAMSDRELADIGVARSDLSARRLAGIGADSTLARNARGTAPRAPANANEDLRAAA